MFNRLKQSFERFQQTLIEGNYRSQPSLWNTLAGTTRDLPATTEVAMGTTMLGTSKSFGKRMLWASAIALISIEAMVWVAAGMGVLGFGLYGLEFVRAKKARNDVITEVNFAGQRVTGTRADLCRLHRAQVRIMNLAGSFLEGSLESTHDTVNRIMDGVKAERARVTVVDPGRYGASKQGYEFSEPGIKLVEKHVPEAPAAQPAPALASAGLRATFNKKALTEDEIVERLVALQEALPPQIIEKVNQRLQRPPPVQPPAL